MTTAAVLAGGHGRRMGGPKATLVVAGRALVEHPLAACRAAGLEAVVVAPASVALPDGVPRLDEPEAGPRHPARGILAALDAAGGAGVLAVACDLPLLEPALLRALADLPGTVMARANGRLQPLLARYAPEARPALEAAAASGAPLHEALAPAVTRVLAEDELRAFGDPERLLLNVNTPADAARAEALLAAGRSVDER